MVEPDAWKEKWKNKVASAGTAIKQIKSGDTVFIGSGTAQPHTLCKALAARAGRISIPYLVDPNTGTEMGESRDILEYLDRTYG